MILILNPAAPTAKCVWLCGDQARDALWLASPVTMSRITLPLEAVRITTVCGVKSFGSVGRQKSDRHIDRQTALRGKAKTSRANITVIQYYILYPVMHTHKHIHL